MAGEGLAEYVGQLARCVKAGAPIGLAERRAAGAEQATRSRIAPFKDQLEQIRRDGNRPDAPILSSDEANLPVQQLVAGDRLGFIPAGPSGQARRAGASSRPRTPQGAVVWGPQTLQHSHSVLSKLMCILAWLQAEPSGSCLC